jgi:hypothetical protein
LGMRDQHRIDPAVGLSQSQGGQGHRAPPVALADIRHLATIRPIECLVAQSPA